MNFRNMFGKLCWIFDMLFSQNKKRLKPFCWKFTNVQKFFMTYCPLYIVKAIPPFLDENTIICPYLVLTNMCIIQRKDILKLSMTVHT